MNGWNVIGTRRPVYLVAVLLVAVFALIAGAAAPEAWAQDEDDDACGRGGGPAVRLPATKLIIEHNATDEDTGVHPTVPTSDLKVTWAPVTATITGKPINPTGYQVIITKDVPDDPHGFSRPTFDVHVPPSVTSLTVSEEFLEPGTGYELEVLALEFSGNQTISVRFFETE